MKKYLIILSGEKTNRVVAWLKEHIQELVIYEIAIIVRLWQLGTAQLWYDEAFTNLLARLDFGNMIQAAVYDVHPPLWYIIEWIMVRLLGDFNWVMRLPSLVFSLWAIYLTYRLGQLLKLSKPAVLVAMAFMAVNGTQIWYAQEARMYAMLQALVLVQLIELIQRRWNNVFLATCLSLWLHNYALIYLAVIGLVALYREWKTPKEQRQWIYLFASFGGAVLCFLPWVYALSIQISQVGASYWIQPFRLGTVIYCISAIFWSFVMDGPMESLAPMVLTGAILLAVVRSIQTRKNGLLLWLSFGPVALVVLASVLWKPILLYRGLIGSVPAMALMLAEMLAGARQSLTNRWIAGVIVLPVICAGFLTIQTSYVKKGNDVLLIKTYLKDYQPGDAIIHFNDGSWVIFSSFSDLPQYELFSDCPPPVGSLSSETRRILGAKRISIQQARTEYNHIYLLGGVGSTSSECEQKEMDQLISQADETLYETVSIYARTGIWRIDNALSKR